MESNGVKGAIHVSEQTATCLHNAGKGHWVTAREEMIEAKGKGRIQTFWVSREAHNTSAPKSCTTYQPSVKDDDDDDDNEVEARLSARLAKDASGSRPNATSSSQGSD